jgi:hypothetical protein
MKLTKKSRRYIAQYAERASQVFDLFQFKWYDLPKGTGKTPGKMEIIDSMTERVQNFTKETHMSYSGRIGITHDELNDYGFKLWIDLSEVKE